MKKKIIVLSLGGSLIVPAKVEPKWLEKFKKTLENNYQNYSFIIVCGGGFVAREYISILSFEHKSQKQQSLAGIMATRMNARLMMQFFGSVANHNLPLTMNEVKNMISKNKVVFCGALRYAPKQTSDSTAARLAAYLKTDFINLTNIDGLYTDNPKTNKNAKFIKQISWSRFLSMASKIKYKPGQHFVLDQKAAKIIKNNKIKTYILGKELKNLQNLLQKKDFRGTSITE
ncbi:MAG: UMP kinase [Candidatus Pacearchaeota archaeon]